MPERYLAGVHLPPGNGRIGRHRCFAQRVFRRADVAQTVEPSHHVCHQRVERHSAGIDCRYDASSPPSLLSQAAALLLEMTSHHAVNIPPERFAPPPQRSRHLVFQRPAPVTLRQEAP